MSQQDEILAAQRDFENKQREIRNDAFEDGQDLAEEAQNGLDDRLERIDGQAASTIWRVAEERDRKVSEAAAERQFADAEYDRLMREAEAAEAMAKSHREEAAIYRRFLSGAEKED